MTRAALAGVAGSAAGRTSTTSSSGVAAGVRSKIRHHGAPRASVYAPGNVAGSGVPMRLSAGEVDAVDVAASVAQRLEGDDFEPKAAYVLDDGVYGRADGGEDEEEWETPKRGKRGKRRARMQYIDVEAEVDDDEEGEEDDEVDELLSEWTTLKREEYMDGGVDVKGDA
ncbi:uncharacterized protein BDZ99DRAFT_463145 [Mytilinidion resinicola]|uniref:Uncharacterized protein n=1 Tax=Mytilinidion resinicola TaxID=574789 RepID=A0A6A6YMR7_9PEZI|nr:uncharacterized protein BDZ99DRAFT_463145 [Mytilinidion resinicola]KAF2809294.1 hypothetical protein BDZ99DRAFT_463145 [Mytilinidion resinicola]